MSVDSNDGARWARELLSDLRNAHFRPRAWLVLVARSLQRTRETERARPALARQARAWSIAGVVGSAGMATLMRARGARGASPRTAAGWAALSGAMLQWHIGMVEGPGGEPRTALGAADAVTYIRLLAAPAMMGSSGDRLSFLALLAGGGTSDALDGVLSRRRGTTRLGRDLDAAADVAFFAAAARAAGTAGWIAPPVAVVIGARELALVAGSALHYFTRSAPPPARTVGATRFAGPLLTLGLALAAGGRRTLGSTVVVVASATATLRHATVLWRDGGQDKR